MPLRQNPSDSGSDRQILPQRGRQHSLAGVNGERAVFPTSAAAAESKPTSAASCERSAGVSEPPHRQSSLPEIPGLPEPQRPECDAPV